MYVERIHYMPTLALKSTIYFPHTQSVSFRFASIRIGGSIAPLGLLPIVIATKQALPASDRFH